jgi:hypothetical protein
VDERWRGGVRRRQALVNPLIGGETFMRVGPSFFQFRYASMSALSLYAGYRAGPVLLVTGMLRNPRTAYREIMGGVGRAITNSSGNGVTLAPALAWSNTGWYTQLYLLPGQRRPRASARHSERNHHARVTLGLEDARDDVRVTIRSSF